MQAVDTGMFCIVAFKYVHLLCDIFVVITREMDMEVDVTEL